MENNIVDNNVPSIFDLNELKIKYKDNPYMLSRLSSFLNNLPNMLECENKKHEERVSRINELTTEQDNFFKVFLSKNQYYYMAYNNLYYEYDGKSYSVIKDDHIHHKLLTTITHGGKLIPWKHKTKLNIIKQIKERNLFKSVPETATIQNVLGFLQTIFQTKTESKYFLTILGDCILKKNSESLLFFVSSTFKKILTLIDSIVYITCGNSIMNNFISKYHDSHNLSLFRLIKINENAISYDIVKNILNNIGLDLLCVATHYSERYTNSDNYLLLRGEDIINYTMYFKTNTSEIVIDDFVSQCIEKVNNVNVNSNISCTSWKNMHYIWKLYLSNLQIPNVIYSNQLQIQLSNLLEHTVDGNNMIFTNITSKYLPRVSSFLLFWEKHITISNEVSESECDYDDEYEIDELSSLYKHSTINHQNISDSEMIKMINHYFSPQVEVIDNKYINNIRCNLWLKNEDIKDFLQSFKTTFLQNEVNFETQLISFDDLYDHYNAHCKAKNILDKKNVYVVSKHFFEKYLVNSLSEYIKFDKFVSSEWSHV